MSWAEQGEEEKEEDDWQPDSFYEIEEIDAPSEVYVMKGRGGPASSNAVSKAKKKYAEDNDVAFRHLTGKKIARKAMSREYGDIVVVVERARLHANDV